MHTSHERTGRTACLLAALYFAAAGALAGTAITINGAIIDSDASRLTIDGLNFPIDGAMNVWLGDTLLVGCTISAKSADCPLPQTASLAGGTWTVRLSAGNSPNSNAEIDVYVPRGGISVGCIAGDFVSCYEGGDRSQIGVGACRSGLRTCGLQGQFGACEGAVTPAPEWKGVSTACRDGVDDDCDGIVDNGCDRLVSSPTRFTQNATFSIPPGVTSITIDAAGGGGGGAGGQTKNPVPGANHPISAYAGGGGGGGGRVHQMISVEEGQQFNVVVGRGGTGGYGNAPGYAGETTMVSGGGNSVNVAGGQGGDIPAGGAGGSGDLPGSAGQPGGTCHAEGVFGSDTATDRASGGDGGDSDLPYGSGGTGGFVDCYAKCEFLTGSGCTGWSVGANGSKGVAGEVVVTWTTSQ